MTHSASIHDLRDELRDYRQHWQEKLLVRRGDDGAWHSVLSSSAVSTATAVVALCRKAPERHGALIGRARAWLAQTQLGDGGWGDSPESPANVTATLLAYAALHNAPAQADAAQRAAQWLTAQLGGVTPAAIRAGILAKYGRDRTFSVPILALCAASGLFGSGRAAWSGIPRLPFELAVLPQRLLSVMNVQVVSYAIPALIAVGLAQHEACHGGLTWQLRRPSIAPALRVLAAKQPASGGFLEAAPLTAFCLLCLCAAGRGGHPVAAAAENFLERTCRDDGSWPIDSNLDQWVTALATRALAGVLPEAERQALAELIRQRQFADVHPFTAARPGGWGWTPLSGAVPDADDSAAALIALHELAGAGAGAGGGPLAPAVVRGCEWLLALQNRDGGIPTFCRGWGKLPFDRSCPDLSAHAYRALSCWQDALPVALRRRVARSRGRLLTYLSAQQGADGSFVPLWFGDQQADDLLAPVYGTAVVLEHLVGMDSAMTTRARDYLLQTQGADGGWGTAQGTHTKLIFTARALAALAGYPGCDEALCRGVAYLRPYLQERQPLPVEPVGLYFSQLWYSEELYPLVFLVRALEQLYARACRRDL